jgi:hypothetical protein
MSILTNIQTNSFLGDRLTDCQVENNLKRIKKKILQGHSTYFYSLYENDIPNDEIEKIGSALIREKIYKNKYFSNKLIYQEDVFIELFGNFIKQSVFFETKAPFHFLKSSYVEKTKKKILSSTNFYVKNNKFITETYNGKSNNKFIQERFNYGLNESLFCDFWASHSKRKINDQNKFLDIDHQYGSIDETCVEITNLKTIKNSKDKEITFVIKKFGEDREDIHFIMNNHEILLQMNVPGFIMKLEDNPEHIDTYKELLN